MAGDWIKMRTDLLTSPKVVRMASALKADRFRIAGGLLSVWSLFDVHSVDGTLSGYSLETLDDMSAWPGFSQAMSDVGWLIVNGESLELPAFDTHNGASAKRRAQDADRKREVRKMSASDADKMRTREEKRREEIKDQKLLPSDDDEEKKNQKPEKIDYESVFEAYARNLPELPQIRIKDDARKRAIKTIIGMDKKFAEPDFFDRYFAHVQKSEFLMGRSDRAWKGCCFDWLMKPANLKKIIEGNYHHA